MSELFVPGVPKPEEDYLELRRLGTKLGIPVPEMFVKVEYTDPDGKTETMYDGRSRTLTRNFWNFVFSYGTPASTSLTAPSSAVQTSCGDGYLGVKSYTGAATSTYYASVSGQGPGGFGDFNAVLGSTTYGIVVGTGTKAESFEASCMSALIANGTGTGQLSYAAQSTALPSYNAGTNTMSCVVTRVMNNNSGGTIVVTELGIMGIASYSGVSNCLFCRDLLGTPISVAAAGTLTVTYTWSVSYPSVAGTSAFSQVELLLGNDNATNGSTTFTDQSSYARTMAALGTSPTYSSTTAPTGMTTSMKFVGTGALTVTDTPALELLDNDFSIEFCVNFSALPSSGYLLSKKASAAATSPVDIYFVTGPSMYININGSVFVSPSLGTWTTNTWYYVYLVRVGNYAMIKIIKADGSSFYTSSATINSANSLLKLTDNTSPWTIGGVSDGTNYLPGTTYISNFRVTIGSARKAGGNAVFVGGGTTDVNLPSAIWSLPLSTSQ